LTLVFLAALARPAAFAQVEPPDTTGGLTLVLLRILILTAASEEFVFRGALFAAWRRAFPITGAGWRRFLAWLAPSLATGLFFALWHIGPTRDMLVRSGDPITVGAFVGPVVATGLAGAVVLGPLREWTKGMAGGVLLHFIMNSAVVIAAYALVHWLCPFPGAAGC
jgi:membrane protease YdiL (CAAX protease family)